MIEAFIDTRAPREVLARLEERTGDMRPATRAVRSLIAEGLARNFESKGSFFGESWPPLAESTRERKARQGLPLEPMVATGLLSQALTGGRGKVARATRTTAAAGASKRIFWLRFSQKGSKGSRHGEQPPRSLIGTTTTQREAAVSIIHRYLETGRVV